MGVALARKLTREGLLPIDQVSIVENLPYVRRSLPTLVEDMFFLTDNDDGKGKLGSCYAAMKNRMNEGIRCKMMMNVKGDVEGLK